MNAALALVAALAAPQTAPGPEIAIEPVAPGVYAALQPTASRFDDSNSAIVVTTAGVVVVDAQNSPAAARAVLARVRELTDAPVRTVIFTHWHGDHVQGASVYRDAFPDVELIAQRLTRGEIEQRAMPDHARILETLPGRIEAGQRALESGTDADGRALTPDERADLEQTVARRLLYLQRAREVRFVLPDTLFEERLTLYRGDTELRLMHYPGHTIGDAVVFLPRERVLCTGDLLDDLPYTGHGSPSALARTLRELEPLEFDHVIPGHGRVRAGKEHLRTVAGMFESLVEQVRAAVTAGKSLEEAQQAVQLDRFREALVTDAASERYWGFFIPEAVARAFDEAGGTR